MKRPVIRVTIQDDNGTVFHTETRSAFNAGIRASEAAIKEIARSEHTIYEAERPVRVEDTYTRRWISRAGRTLTVSVVKESTEMSETRYPRPAPRPNGRALHASVNPTAWYIDGYRGDRLIDTVGPYPSKSEANAAMRAIKRESSLEWGDPYQGMDMGHAFPVRERRGAVHTTPGPRTRKRGVRESNAEADGEAHAREQVESDHFRDWVHEQLVEASRMDPSQVLPLETKSDAKVIARNMLQQLEWDMSREINAPGEFMRGARNVLRDPRVRDHLADEILEMNRNIRGGSHEMRAPRMVADFNTLEDLMQHAASQDGATHVVATRSEAALYFPNSDGWYEKAKVWRKGGYWHAQGPSERTRVPKLPKGARPIQRQERQFRVAEGEPRRRHHAVRAVITRVGARCTAKVYDNNGYLMSGISNPSECEYVTRKIEEWFPGIPIEYVQPEPQPKRRSTRPSSRASSSRSRSPRSRRTRP